MLVRDLMVRDVKSCTAFSTLNAAAQIMWDHDCGCVPVLEEDLRVIGMVTDRDICMAAYIQGGSLKDAQVSSAMSKKVFSCKSEDDLAVAEQTMRHNKVRRLPVIDADGRLVGILSLNDIAREAERERASRAWRDVKDADVTETLGAICEPHRRVAISQAA